MTEPRALYLAPVDAAVEQPGDGATSDADGLPSVLGRRLVDGVALGGEHDAVGAACLRGRDLAVERVGEHELGVAVERVAEAGAAGDVLPELIAGMKDDHLLGRKLLARTVLAHDEGVGGDAGRPALEPPGRGGEALAPVRDRDVGGRGLEDLLEAEAAPPPSGAAGVTPEP